MKGMRKGIEKGKWLNRPLAQVLATGWRPVHRTADEPEE